MNANKENLLKMAGYLESDAMEGKLFDMRSFNCCVLGHGLDAFGYTSANSLDNYYITKTCNDFAEEVLGVSVNDYAWTFCFGAQWVKDGKSDRFAAAQRLRYVAIHGNAPSHEQWGRFSECPQPLVDPCTSVEVNFEAVACE